jgi:Flp pilus assembly protein TadD
MARERTKSPNPWGTAGPIPAGATPQRGAGTGAVILAVAGLVLLTMLVYWNGVRGEFLGPDHALFQHGPLTKPPVGPGAESSLPQWLPRAVTTFSLALDRSIWGPLPAGFRASNLILHVLATLAAFALFLEWTGRRLIIALPAALLFAVHPIHVEAVDVVGARGEILAALFAFLSLLFLWRARRGATGALLFALALFLLATFSSPIAFAIPVFLLFADALSDGGLIVASKRFLGQWALYTVAALPAVVVSLLVSTATFSVNPWLAGRAALLMTWLLAVPAPLSTYRIIGPGQGVNALSLLAILAFLGLLTATAEGCRRLARHMKDSGIPPEADLPVLCRGWLLALIPVVFLALCAPPPPGPDVPFPVLDHRLYLPSAGMCLALAASISLLASRLGTRTSRAFLAASTLGAFMIAVPYIAILRSRLPVFRNDVELYAAAATQEPRSAELRMQLAHAAAARGQTERAIQILTPLLEQRPGDAKLRLVLGNFHRDVRDLEKAESEVREALRLDPSLAAAHNTLGLIERDRGNIRGAESEYREAVRLDPALADAHSNLGALLVAYGSPDEARTELRRAVELDPTHGDAAANLASFLLKQNLQEEALAVLRDGLRYSEGNARLHYHVGVVLQRQGDREGAERAYQRAIALDPSYARPMNNLSVLLTEQKRYPEAIALLQRISTLEPQNEQAHYNLGIVYRLSGDKVRAAAEFGAALKLRPDHPDASRALSDMASGAEPPSALPTTPAP